MLIVSVKSCCINEKCVLTFVSQVVVFPWYMLFPDESRSGVNAKLEIWQDALESKGFQLSRVKTKYIECKFSKSKNIEKSTVRLDGQEIQKSESFQINNS